MTKKILYSFQLPEDVSREELNERAAHLDMKVARLFDFATHLITKCSVFFLKYLGDLAGQYSMEPWVIIEKILIDRKAQRDVFQKYWGADPRGQLAMMSDENGPIIGQELYDALFNYYDQQERPKWLLNKYSPAEKPRTDQQREQGQLSAMKYNLKKRLLSHPDDQELANEIEKIEARLKKLRDENPEPPPSAADIAFQKRMDTEPEFKAAVFFSFEIDQRARYIEREHGEDKAIEYRKLITPLSKARKYDEALAMWPWPK